MPLRLNSITLELMLLFVGVLALAETANVAYHYLDRSEALADLEAVRIADGISVIAALTDEMPQETRSTLLDNLRGSDLPVSWAAEPWVSGDKDESEEARLLHQLLMRVLPHATEVKVYFAHSDAELPSGVGHPAMLWHRAGSFPEPIQKIIDELSAEPTFLVSVRLHDGSWLNFLAAYVETIDFWPIRSVLILAGLTTIIAVLSIWGIARLTAPFKTFTTAARRLGTDVNTTPIAERGPRDVRGAIRAFNEMQMRLQRLIEDRTQMLAAVSHDLRTPITRMRLRLEGIKAQPQRRKFVQNLDEMERMVRDLLSFAKEDALLEPTHRVDLTATLHSLCDDLADKGFDVSFNGNGRVPYMCRPIAIRRCLGNLIDNALKYGQYAEVSLEVCDGEIMIRIDDRGPGVPEGLREEVFRPFFRIEGSRNRETGGSGLGLTVARSVARDHGGDVSLGQSPAGGLRVTVILPADDRVPAPGLRPLSTEWPRRSPPSGSLDRPSGGV